MEKDLFVCYAFAAFQCICINNNDESRIKAYSDAFVRWYKIEFYYHQLK